MISTSLGTFMVGWVVTVVTLYTLFVVCCLIVSRRPRPLCAGCGNGEPTHIHPDGGPGGLCETCFKEWMHR